MKHLYIQASIILNILILKKSDYPYPKVNISILEIDRVDSKDISYQQEQRPF